MNASSSALSRQERCELAKFIVKFEKKFHGNSKAPVWQYFDELWYTLLLKLLRSLCYNINISGR